MATADLEQQWPELKETYSLMTEEELRRVADDSFDLMPIAKEALQAVIAEKGFKILLMEAPAPQEPQAIEPETGESPEDDLVSICELKSEADAKKAKAILDASFIASCLGPENIVDLENFKGSFAGGVDLKVFSDFARRASQALDQFAPELMKWDDDVPEDEDELDYAVTCPKCQSQDIIFDEADPPPDNSRFAAMLHWTCAECGHQWKDKGFSHIVNNNARGQSSSSG